MFTSRIYHSLNLDIVTNTSSNIVYVLMAESIKDNKMLEPIAERNNVNVIVVSGMEWARDMTPWRVPRIYSRY